MLAHHGQDQADTANTARKKRQRRQANVLYKMRNFVDTMAEVGDDDECVNGTE